MKARANSVRQESAPAPHPAFAPLHAQLVGAAEGGVRALLASESGRRRLLTLYPVSLASYEAFFVRFYMVRPTQKAALYHARPAEQLSGVLSSVDLTMMLEAKSGQLSDEQWERHGEIFYEGMFGEVPKDLGYLGDRIKDNANAKAWRDGTIVYGTYDLIRLQMWPLLKAMWLLHLWRPSEVKRLSVDTRGHFRAGLIATADFYGLRLDPKLLDDLVVDSAAAER